MIIKCYGIYLEKLIQQYSIQEDNYNKMQSEF